MEKSIVLYERGNKFEKAYIQTLAGEEVVVSKVLIVVNLKNTRTSIR